VPQQRSPAPVVHSSPSGRQQLPPKHTPSLQHVSPAWHVASRFLQQPDVFQLQPPEHVTVPVQLAPTCTLHMRVFPVSHCSGGSTFPSPQSEHGISLY
jgi:hypothetical protein